MKKIYRTSVLIIAAVMALSLCACGKSDETKDSAAPASVSETEQLTAAGILDKLRDTGLCPQLDERADFGGDVFTNACEKLYGEPPEKFTDGGIMFVSSGASADEISVLSSTDADCRQLLEDRKQRRYKDFEGYAPAELEKIEKARIFSAGGLWVMIISDNAEDAEKLITG